MNLYIAVVFGAGCCHSLRGVGWFDWAILGGLGWRGESDQREHEEDKRKQRLGRGIMRTENVYLTLGNCSSITVSAIRMRGHWSAISRQTDWLAQQYVPQAARIPSA